MKKQETYCSEHPPRQRKEEGGVMNRQEIPRITGRKGLVQMMSYKAEHFCRPMARNHRTANGLPEWVAKTIRTVMRFHGREGDLQVRFLRTRDAWRAAGCPADRPPWTVIEQRVSKEVV